MPSSHIPRAEAISIDPPQRHLLEVAHEALESAGVTLDDIMGTDTAVFAGKYDFLTTFSYGHAHAQRC